MSENESSKQIFEFRQRVFLLINVGFFVLALLTGIFALITSGTYTTGAFLLSIFTAISFVIVKLNKINFGYLFLYYNHNICELLRYVCFTFCIYRHNITDWNINMFVFKKCQINHFIIYM